MVVNFNDIKHLAQHVNLPIAYDEGEPYLLHTDKDTGLMIKFKISRISESVRFELIDSNTENILDSGGNYLHLNPYTDLLFIEHCIKTTDFKKYKFELDSKLTSGVLGNLKKNNLNLGIVTRWVDDIQLSYILEDFRKFIITGGYPEIVKLEQEEKIDWNQAIAALSYCLMKFYDKNKRD